jgi:hypothetical protein
VGKIFDNMQKCGVIEVSDSLWSFPVVLVPKNGDVRFCMDYRKLSDATKIGCFPLPQFDNTLDTLAAAMRILHSGPEERLLAVDLLLDKERTAFSAGQGLWQLTIMPFGFR